MDDIQIIYNMKLDVNFEVIILAELSVQVNQNEGSLRNSQNFPDGSYHSSLGSYPGFGYSFEKQHL